MPVSQVILKSEYCPDASSLTWISRRTPWNGNRDANVLFLYVEVLHGAIHLVVIK